MYYGWKAFFITFYTFLLCILAYSYISYNSKIVTYNLNSSVEVYPIEVNPIEAYFIGIHTVYILSYGFLWLLINFDNLLLGINCCISKSTYCTMYIYMGNLQDYH
jgi:hypothetical protein